MGKSPGSCLTHSLPAMLTGTQGSNKVPPQLSVPSQLLDGAPAVALDGMLVIVSLTPPPDLAFNSPVPDIHAPGYRETLWE